MSGVPVTIPNLPAVTPDTADIFPAWDSSAGITGRFTVGNLGTIYAPLAGATFTGPISAPISNGGFSIFAASSDNGASNGGIIAASRNSNASTPAPGALVMGRANPNGNHYLWADDSATLRIIANTIPINSNYATAGTIVGSQTSHISTKELLGVGPTGEEALAYIAGGAAAVRHFRYKEMEEGFPSTRPYGEETFHGIVLGLEGIDASRYGMDIDEAHAEGKALNTINFVGDAAVAITYLATRLAGALAQIEELTARVATLEAAGATG